MNKARLLICAGFLTSSMAALLAIGHGMAADDASKAPPVTAADVAAMNKEALKQIDLSLKRPTAKISAKRIRTSAFVIALAAQDAAQHHAGDALQFILLRDEAVHLAEAAATSKINVENAQKHTALLNAYPHLTTAAQSRTVDLLQDFGMADVMRVFEKRVKGGQEVELQMLNLENVRRTYKPRQLEDWRLSALKIMMIADLVRNHPPDAGPEKQKQWQQFSDAMSQTAGDTLQTAKAKDSKAFRTALLKLNDTCTNCHQVFKKAR